MRKLNFIEGEYYHIYNRGVDKRKIFLNKQDYEFFLHLLFLYNTEKNIVTRNLKNDFDRGSSIVEIGAYSLMPNHFHILIREKTDFGISKYIHKISTVYSMYFNEKYNRTGRLFEGVFKATNASSDNHLKYLYSYIHLNPLKIINSQWREGRVNTKETLEYVFNYKYSSLKEYLNKKYSILEPQNFPDYFRAPEDHKKELFDWLKEENT